jgi:cytochrome c-type biogenesis protein CcmH
LSRRLRAVSAALTLALLASTSALAVEPNERLAEPALEARARTLSRELRCLVCQNESIDDSGADLAHDLRVLLRERIKDGDSDRQALQFLVDRYGDFILLKPPVEPATYVLWFGPAVVLALGLAGIAVYYRRRAAAPDGAPAPLSETERQRLADLLREGEG